MLVSGCDGTTHCTSAKSSPAGEINQLEDALETAGDQRSMNDASGNIAGYWDRELAKEEQMMHETLDVERRESFDAACAVWQAWREVETRFQSSAYADGTIEGMVACNDHAGITRDRALGLRALRESGPDG